MKTYIFLYADSKESNRLEDFKEFEIKSFRFSQAFREFLNFLRNHPCQYIGYGYAYYVISDVRKSYRFYTKENIIRLSCVKDEHNAKFWEMYDEN